MSDDLDLHGIDQRHEPDPQFRAALHRRLVAIIEGTVPTDVTDPVDVTTIELESARRRPGSRRTRWITRGAIALAGVAAIVVLIALVGSGDDGTSPADNPSVSTSVSNGWVGFAAASDSKPGQVTYPDYDIYVAREGSSARRVAGSDTDELAQVCPAFSPDAGRLVFGEAEGSEDTAYHDAALVIADVSADGELAEAARVPLGRGSPPPCGIWSADGRWVAFGVDAPLVQGPEDADGMNPRSPTGHSVDEVWVVDTQSDDIRRLTGLFVTDLAWAPHVLELAFIGNEISVYSVASDEIRPLVSPSGTGLDERGQLDGAASLDWSPDGRTIAFTGPSPTSAVDGGIWLMDADGTDERILVPEVRFNHGLGPVWSPNGDRIAYQRLCDVNPLGAPCGPEEHEVVVVTVNDGEGEGEGEPAGTQEVIPAPQTGGPDGPIWWNPFSVTWSPDGTALLYLAWNTARLESIPQDGLVAVPLDGATPPVVLSGDLVPAVYSGVPWLPDQRWGRQPDG